MDTRNIRTWLREERKDGVTQGKIAKTVGISTEYYNRIERGHVRPTFELWERIARVVNPQIEEVDLTEIFMNSDPEAKAMNPDEANLLDAYRSGNLTRLLHIFEKLKRNQRGL